jgi:hypothetical protein
MATRHFPVEPISAFDPLRTLGAQAINASVRVRACLDVLSKRAPAIVGATLCAALLGAWTGAPFWLTNALAVVVGILGLVLLASKRRRQFRTEEEFGSASVRDWIAFELAGKGTPRGYYLLGFSGILTIFVSGVESPYSKLAWAGLFLGVVWGIVNARHPADEASQR